MTHVHGDIAREQRSVEGNREGWSEGVCVPAFGRVHHFIAAVLFSARLDFAPPTCRVCVCWEIIGVAWAFPSLLLILPLPSHH